jgi:hypothetical protein
MYKARTREARENSLVISPLYLWTKVVSQLYIQPLTSTKHDVFHKHISLRFYTFSISFCIS